MDGILSWPVDRSLRTPVHGDGADDRVPVGRVRFVTAILDADAAVNLRPSSHEPGQAAELALPPAATALSEECRRPRRNQPYKPPLLL